MSESMADFEKEIDESLKTLNVVENEGEATEEETGFNAWDKVQQYLEDGTVLTLKVGGIVNKGVIVYVDGLRGFIPASHLEIGYVEDTNPYLGKTVEAKVITADPEKNRLVLSVKEVLYDKKRAEKEARINAIEAGAVLTGKVESLMPYGAFVNLGNDISGLVHISQIAQKRIESPAEVLKAGQEVNVKVLKVENGKISLSMKALEEVAPEEEDTSGEEVVSYKDEGPLRMKIILICDFSRSVLNTRPYPALASRPQIRIISFSAGCVLPVGEKNLYIISGEIYDKLYCCRTRRFHRGNTPLSYRINPCL